MGMFMMLVLFIMVATLFIWIESKLDIKMFSTGESDARKTRRYKRELRRRIKQHKHG